jgi:hypothetical protein
VIAATAFRRRSLEKIVNKMWGMYMCTNAGTSRTFF